MAAKLSQTHVEYESGGVTYRWALAGWTYGEEQGTHGIAWEGDAGRPTSPTLSLSAGRGPQSAPFAFAVHGVLAAVDGFGIDPGGGRPDGLPSDIPMLISSDPVVRLSSMSPGGLVTT